MPAGRALELELDECALAHRQRAAAEQLQDYLAQRLEVAERALGPAEAAAPFEMPKFELPKDLSLPKLPEGFELPKLPKF